MTERISHEDKERGRRKKNITQRRRAHGGRVEKKVRKKEKWSEE
jgi:hypothetical protein